jgi:outer membrane protein OmpA-like peptidoglycan-associated protein
MRNVLTLTLLLALGSAARAQDAPAQSKDSSLDKKIVTVHFDVDKADILPRDRPILDSLSMNRAAVRLVGYTDNSSTDAHNSQLSVQRAHAVRDYLRSKGWPDSLFLNVDGFGSSHPLNDNDGAAKKSLNRRVEIILQRPHHSTLADMFKDSAHLVGQNIILRHVNFYPGRHVPLPEAYRPMQELLVIMRTHASLHIEIQGYVCCNSDGFDGRDNDTHTDDLSAQRAKLVYDFLIGNGVEKERVSYKGYGSSNKIYPEEKDLLEQAANRRVEIKVLGFK